MSRLILSALLVGLSLSADFAQGMDRQKVALTIHHRLDTPAAVKTLSESLFALMEVEASLLPDVIVVERMQIDAALSELVLDRTFQADAESRLQLGKLSTADVILTLEVLPPEPKTGKNTPAGPNEEKEPPKVLIRIVKAQTAAILGATIAPLEAERIDDAAVQLAEYLSNVLAAPEQAGVTVAVGALESEGRFDRLRPLELGIRDMLTTGLRRIGRFQVLQRSSMVELNRELDLIRSGLANRAELPKSLPTRKAAYLLSGTLNERDEGGKRLISVSTKLVHAATNRVELELRFESTAEDLPDALARQALLIGGHLAKSQGIAAPQIVKGKLDEAETLLENAVRDLKRFRRRSPIDFGFRHLDLPWESQAKLPPIVNADSQLGRHLLLKSIDRLESVRFIYPHRADAAYALGFCYSFHIPDVANPDRAAEMLETAFRQNVDGKVGAAALELLAELNFHHQEGTEIPKLRETTAERIAFAFRNMPAEHRTYRWARLPELLSGLSLKKENMRPVVETLTAAEAIVRTGDRKHQGGLASSTMRLAAHVLAQGDESAKAFAGGMLENWAKSEQPALSLPASRYLGYHAMGQKDLDAAASWFLRAVAICEKHPDASSPTEHANLLMHAGRTLRRTGRFEKAIEFLDKAAKIDRQTELNRGYVAFETGMCLEAMGKTKEALEIYLEAAFESEDTINNTDVEGRIQALGGVPVDPESEIEVRYLSGPENQPCYARVLATDGDKLFCAGGYVGQASRGVLIFDIARETWQHTGEDLGRVTCLALTDDKLWAGTDGRGLWRYDLLTKQWTGWTTEKGLPDDRIVSLAVNDNAVYAGVGTQASGGLIRLEAEKIKVFDETGSPRTAATHLVFHEGTLYVTARQAVHELNLDSGVWTEIKGPSPRLFAGEGALWASSMGKEIYPYDPAGEVKETYKEAWFPRGAGKAGYNVNFVIHKGGQIWFGGDPWERFQSAGFYRLDEKTGDFKKFGLRDGFKISTTYSTYAGVVAVDRMWIATSAGLAEVKHRGHASRTE